MIYTIIPERLRYSIDLSIYNIFTERGSHEGQLKILNLLYESFLSLLIFPVFWSKGITLISRNSENLQRLSIDCDTVGQGGATSVCPHFVPWGSQRYTRLFPHHPPPPAPLPLPLTAPLHPLPPGPQAILLLQHSLPLLQVHTSVL